MIYTDTNHRLGSNLYRHESALLLWAEGYSGINGILVQVPLESKHQQKDKQLLMSSPTHPASDIKTQDKNVIVLRCTSNFQCCSYQLLLRRMEDGAKIGSFNMF